MPAMDYETAFELLGSTGRLMISLDDTVLRVRFAPDPQPTGEALPAAETETSATSDDQQQFARLESEDEGAEAAAHFVQRSGIDTTFAHVLDLPDESGMQ